MVKIFSITDEYIELIKLLKAASVAQSGADAKDLVRNNLVKVNGEIETRLRRKLVVADMVIYNGTTITIA